MTHIQHRKVRYVKCPKCGRILPEPDQVPLYTCGGCDTVLQAKYYRKEKEALVPSVTSEDVKSNSNGQTREVGKSSGSSQRSSGEQSSIQNQESDENTIDDCNSEQNGDRVLLGNNSGESEDKRLDEFDSGGKQADQLPIETKTKEGGSEEDQYDDIPIEKLNNTRETSTNTESEVKQDENDEMEQCQDIVDLDKQKEVEHGNFVNELFHPTEKLTQFELDNVAQGSRISGNERDCLADENPIEMEKLSKKYETGKEQKSFMNRLLEKLTNVSISKDAPTSTQIEVRDESHSASVPPSASEMNASDVLQDPDSKISSVVEETSKQKIDNYDGANKTETSKIIENNTQETSTGNDKQEQCEDIQLEVVQGNSTEEASIQVQSLPTEKTEETQTVGISEGRPTEKTEETQTVSIAEGSGVSGKSNGKEEKNITEGITEKLVSVTITNNGLMSTEVHNGEASLRYIDDSDFNGYGKKRSTSKAENSTKQSPAYDGSVSSCDGNDDHVPRQPQHLNEGSFSENDASSRIKHGNWRTRTQVKSSSQQLSNENLKQNIVESVRESDIPRHYRNRRRKDENFPPGFALRRRPSDVAFETGSSSSYVPDEGPRDRNRYENQEQLWSKLYGQRRFPEGTWRKNDVLPPVYYNDERSGEFYQRYQEYSGIRRREESRSFSGNIPRTRYSEEMYNVRYQFPDARPWSSQLPPGPLGPPRGAYYMDRSGETSWDPYDPYQTNPSRFSDFQSYGWGHDPVYLSDDQRHRDWLTKRSYMREKQQANKRRLRPMAGGAPFITCHFCFEVLQLPQEFLVPRRKRAHSLKCGACSYILKFSLGNDSCLAPCLPRDFETNPETDARSAPGREKRKDMLSNSRTGGDEGASSSEQPREVAVTWKLPGRSKSPLHRLMGYSSPHDLLTEHAVDDEY